VPREKARWQVRQILKSLESWIQHWSSRTISHNAIMTLQWLSLFHLNWYRLNKERDVREAVLFMPPEGRFEGPDLKGTHHGL
jgi:hypothetical protein